MSSGSRRRRRDPASRRAGKRMAPNASLLGEALLRCHPSFSSFVKFHPSYPRFEGIRGGTGNLLDLEPS